MDKFDRFQMLHRIFTDRRRPVPITVLTEKLECTEKTVKRAMNQMCNYLNAPIEYSRSENGWHYAQQPGELFQLPGLWLTSEELQSLTLLLNVLENFGNGLLNDELAATEKQIDKLLQARGISPSAFAKHIKVLAVANRPVATKIISDVGEALLKRLQLCIQYTSYNREQTRRNISPQTLVYYRENWYLDAWCHLRKGLRTFSLARIDKAKITEEKAKNISDQELKTHFSESYGLFAGKPEHTAKLRFFPEIAREISMQQWHPEQSGGWDGEEYLLSFPYSDPRELVGDILRHVPHVVVEGPDNLRYIVRMRLSEAAGLYNVLDR